METEAVQPMIEKATESAMWEERCRALQRQTLLLCAFFVIISVLALWQFMDLRAERDRYRSLFESYKATGSS